ncbi:hypothetical protein N0V82_008543 [Gnomoniopsis sp. IMI 355080]|nr:hypothetical protein N0V82_008543 [Gnomoniopsis sp. IMI 355080]
MTDPSKPKRLFDLINNVDKRYISVPHDFDYGRLYKLLLPEDHRPHGYLTSDTVHKLPWTPDFDIDHAKLSIQLNLASGTISASTINAALQAVVDGALALGPTVFPRLTSHSEMFRILGAKPYAGGGSNIIQLERFAAPLFGICCRGAHMTAYIKDSLAGSLKVWVARRAANLHTYPGMLDTTVAGGVKAADSPRACIVAESDEEAALPRAYVEERLVATGAVSYVSLSANGITPTVLYVYDLEMAEGMEPRPKDGEVEGFFLMGVEEVVRHMMAGEFKPNCCLVMLDFFVRHGVLTEENETDYLEILIRLRRVLPVPITAR